MAERGTLSARISESPDSPNGVFYAASRFGGCALHSRGPLPRLHDKPATANGVTWLTAINRQGRTGSVTDTPCATMPLDGLKRIVDFGAGKLRNAKYLLRSRHAFKVFAVEFEECYQTPKAAEVLKTTMKRYSEEFFLLKYPNPFLKHKATFDAALFINVASVMPRPHERLRALREIADRLRPGGLFLWMTQYGEPHYRPGVTQRLSVEDGWAYNLHQAYQTFYKEWRIPEVIETVSKAGFKELRQSTANHHRAFLFERV